VVLSLCLVTAGLAPVALSAPGDLVIPRKEGAMSVDSMPASVFPHWIHRVRYRCDACHTRLFKMELGATEISMDLMGEGKSCGVCHDGERAFPISMNSCNRCHSASAE
jgi:c(7)-type cytochrome triheme protein